MKGKGQFLYLGLIACWVSLLSGCSSNVIAFSAGYASGVMTSSKVEQWLANQAHQGEVGGNYHLIHGGR